MEETKQDHEQQPEKQPPAETIEFGGLIWTLDKDCSRGVEYHAVHNEIGKFRIYQYPEESYSGNKWLWDVYFNKLIDEEHKPKIFDIRAWRIVDSAAEAMQGCLDAKEQFLADVKRLALGLGVGNYATGFMDGQAKLVEKIRMVLP